MRRYLSLESTPMIMIKSTRTVFHGWKPPIIKSSGVTGACRLKRESIVSCGFALRVRACGVHRRQQPRRNPLIGHCTAPLLGSQGAESLHGLRVPCPFPDRCTTIFRRMLARSCYVWASGLRVGTRTKRISGSNMDFTTEAKIFEKINSSYLPGT